MLEVVSLEDARQVTFARFSAWRAALQDRVEEVALSQAVGRFTCADVTAAEGVPPFDRSMVDGFAVVARDTFGCSEALPALLILAGEVTMGKDASVACAPDACVRIPTGGMLPAGADAVVMLEHCEEYGDGTVGVAKPVAPGENVVFQNDDVAPGQVLIASGSRLLPHHIGTLASLGQTRVAVQARPRVAVISTGDEIIPADEVPQAAQMRDVNAPMLAAAIEACGAVPVAFGIVPDEYEALLACVEKALATCDMVLVSGGSSAGARDNTARVLAELGELLFHGIAVKPGKPTMVADVAGKPVFGLPGHPVAAYYLFLELVRPLLAGGAAKGNVAKADEDALGEDASRVGEVGEGETRVRATVSAGVPSNHGRAEFVAVRLEERDGARVAVPIRGKSGLISQLAGADGFFVIDRNVEGVSAGTTVDVRLFAR